MWICARCGEPHQDQFRECWKCVGAEMEEVEAAQAPPVRPAAPAPERRLRSVKSILLRAAVGFLVGTLVAMSSFNFILPQTILPSEAMSPAGRSLFALVVGLIFGLVVGLFFWVVLPYEPGQQPTKTEANTTGSTDQIM